MSARWPKDCPVLLAVGGNDHWHKTHLELLEVDRNPDGTLPVWHLCGAPHLGYVFPASCLRPLTPAARDMLALVKP